MFDLDALLADVQSAIGERSAPGAVKDVLERHVANPGAMAEAMAPKVGGLRLLVRRPDVTVIDAAWAPGMRLMPHDHRMWAVIAIYQGAEDNEFFRRAPDGSLRESNGRRLDVGDVVVLGDATIHAVSNPTRVVTGAIHVYGGDFVSRPRSQWGPGDLIERPWDFDVFNREFERANAAAGLTDS